MSSWSGLAGGAGSGALLLAVLAAGAAVLVWPWGSRTTGRRPDSGRPGRTGPTHPGGRRLMVAIRRRARPHPAAAPARRRAVPVGLATVAVACWATEAEPVVRGGVWLSLPVVAGLAIVALGRLEPRAARRRRLQLVLDLPEALELLAAGLEAGRPLRSATEAVVGVTDGPLAADLAEVTTAVRLGRAEDEVWRELRGHPVLGPVATDLARSASSGTRLADILAVHARVARRQRHAELEATAKAVGVRCLLPLMVCFLPAFLLVGVVPIVGSVLGPALR